jgi:ferredoxin
MEPGPANLDDLFDIKWDVLEAEPGEKESEATPPPTETLGGKLPVEPPPIGEEAGPPDYDPARVREELLDFHYYGIRDKDTDTKAGRPLPALLYQYKDLARVRHEYPMCLIEDGGDVPAKPLSRIFDELVEETAGEGDAGERAKHHLLRLEFAVRSFSADGGSAGKRGSTRVSRLGRLTDLWDRAADELLSTKKLGEEKAASFRADLEAARGALRDDGDVIPCSADAPARLFEASRAACWRECNREWLDDLDVVIRKLEDILTADYNRSEAAKSAEHLKESAGTRADDELDFSAMSEILSESHLGDPLPSERRDRIQHTLNIIRRVRPLFVEPTGKSGGEVPPFPLETIVNNCESATEHYHARMKVMIEFFKSVRIARLEIANGYRAETHDPFFASFDVNRLTDEELAHCPPVLLRLDRKFLAKHDKTALLDLLQTDIPVKVLVELDDLCGRDDYGQPSALPGWTARLASVAMALGHVYVMQATVSRASYMLDGMTEGLQYDGPALFSVYTGDPTQQPDLPSYLVAAAAEESRLFPSFTFNPGRGDTLANRFEIDHNPGYERAWPEESFAYLTGAEQENTIDLPFTPADFLLTDARMDAQFWPVTPEKWHEDMIPLGEYLREAAIHEGRKIPYATAVADGMVVRVVVTRFVLEAVDMAARYWRGLQELGGIDNSHALAALARERDRLEEEKRLEVETIEKKYASELDKDIGALSEEIIRRIAAQMITGGAAGSAPLSFASTAAPAAAPAAPAAPPAAGDTGAAPAEAVEEEEEEAVTFDDPYIDTPLCTSCNECTNLNGQLFGYNENKQAFVKDPSAGTFKDLVLAAEKCPVHIIHPGKPKNPNEPDLDGLVARAARFN